MLQKNRMSAEKTPTRHWYTRRDGVERGPWPENQISRYILLGRIHAEDEVRCDAGEWKKLCQVPDLIPDVMKLPPGRENTQKLLMARMREDERKPGDRRDRQARPPAGVLERRSGKDRRQPETDIALRHRQLKYQVAHTARRSARLYRYPVVAMLLVFSGLFFSYLGKMMPAKPEVPDCSATPRPGVNWEHCNLTGLQATGGQLSGAHMSNSRLDSAQLQSAELVGVNLEYSSLNLSNLQQADLRQSSLVGAVLRGADLRNATLENANLAYANLSGAQIEGADFSGAILDNAIWVDQQTCASGSTGICR